MAETLTIRGWLQTSTDSFQPAASNGEPVLILRVSKRPFIRNSIILGVLFVVLAWLAGVWQGFAILGLLYLFVEAYQYFVLLRRFNSWQIQFYDKRFKIFYRGDMLRDANYSEIVAITNKRTGLFSKLPALYGKDHKLLAVIPSNPKKRELGGDDVLSWLKTKLSNASTRE
ncbi:MAG: hypothetical protein ACREBS_12060 [Nitrososphaerales archaeon]